MDCGAEFSLWGIRLRFTFGFFAVWAILLADSGNSECAEIALMSCLLHESGHVAAMLLAGVKIRSLVFYSGGISLRSCTPAEYSGAFREIMILCGGCAVNLAVFAAAVLAGSRMWALTNLSLALFNLLPFSTLDGGRLIKTAVSRMCPCADIDGAQRICDVIFGIAAVLFFVSKGNISFTLPLTLAMIILEGLADKS